MRRAVGGRRVWYGTMTRSYVHTCLPMLIALTSVSLLFALATFLPLWRTSRWWVRMFDFPRLQLMTLGIILLSLWAVSIEERGVVAWCSVAATSASLLYQCLRILPYTPLWRQQVVGASGGHGRTLKLCVSNVLMQNEDYERWAAVVLEDKPDILLAVETDSSWCEAIAARARDYPHRIALPQDNTYGMMLLSKLPIEDHEVRCISDERVPSVWATLCLPSGERLRFVGLHPRPPRPELGFDAHLRDAELVLVARTLSKEAPEMPVIVAGDLNDVAWSDSTRLFQRLSGLLDLRVGRGLFSSFHAQRWWMRWPLDHVFVSGEFAYRQMRLLSDTGSDHFPVSVSLALPPREPDANEELEPEGADHDDAADVVEEAAEFERNLSPEDKRERDQLDR